MEVLLLFFSFSSTHILKHWNTQNESILTVGEQDYINIALLCLFEYSDWGGACEQQKDMLKITESQNSSIIEWFGLQGAAKIIWFHSPAMFRVATRSRLLRASSNMALNTYRDEASTLIWRTCSSASPLCLTSKINFPSSSLKPFQLVLSMSVHIGSYRPSPSPTPHPAY